jgi:hypothetical protein
MGRRRHLLALVLPAVVGTGLAAATAHAGDQAVVATRATEPRAPAVAVAASGRAVVAWTAVAGERFAVVARIRPARGAPWGAARRISALESTRPDPPAAAIGADGRAVVAWRAGNGPVQGATLPSGADAWTRSTIATGGTGFISPDLAPGASATVVWADRIGTRTRARRAVLAGGTWRADPPLDLIDAGIMPAGAGGTPPALAAGARGDAAVAWPAADANAAIAPRTVSVALFAGGAWQPARTLAASGGHATLAVGDAGHAAVGWLDDGRVLRVTVRDPGDSGWPVAQVVGEALGAAGLAFPRLAVNREGYAVAAWADGAAGPGGTLALRAAVRSGANGIWTAAVNVYDDFVFFPVLDLSTVRAVVDEYRVAHLAWMDPEGPGSATVHAVHSDGQAWRRDVTIGIGEDLNEAALSASALGGDLLATPRAVALGPPNVELVAAAFPPAARIELSSRALLINQRIAQAAIRRVNAVDDLLREGIPRARLRPGSITAADFGSGVTIAGTPTGSTPAPVFTTLPVPAGGDDPASVTATPAQVRINQRIAQVAVLRANATRARFTTGLTSADIQDGSVGAEALAPGLTITGAVPTDVVPAAPAPQAISDDDGVVLSARQLLINQRIAQAAVLRANWLVERVEGGIGGADIRDGSLGRDDIDPALLNGG